MIANTFRIIRMNILRDKKTFQDHDLVRLRGSEQ